jgi:hypothetical protein
MENLPRDIELVLLPIHNRWCNRFRRIENTGCYSLVPQPDQPILKISIEKIQGVWTLVGDADFLKSRVVKIGDLHHQVTPIGEWSFGAQVYDI